MFSLCHIDWFKEADEKSRDTICGYIRESHSLFPRNNTYYLIPALVNFIVLYYYCYQPPIAITIHFAEYFEQSPIKLNVPSKLSVQETINYAIREWETERAAYKLRGKTSKDYELRCMDDGEIDDDMPSFARHAQISQIGENIFGLKCINYNPPIPDIPDIPCIPRYIERIFIRVTVPGPMDETLVLALDKDATAWKIRDLFVLLNKRKHQAAFHPMYFNLYNKGETRPSQALSYVTRVDELPSRDLVMLPKCLTQNDDIESAYQFNLVRLANEQREYRCIKIRKNRENKYRLLTVDRYRIIKEAMEVIIEDPGQQIKDIVFGFIKESQCLFTSQDPWYNIPPLVIHLCLKFYYFKECWKPLEVTQHHIPIDITCITNIGVCGENKKQFSIEYECLGKGKKRKQFYELLSVKDCQHIVAKIRYLIILRKLQG